MKAVELALVAVSSFAICGAASAAGPKSRKYVQNVVPLVVQKHVPEVGQISEAALGESLIASYLTVSRPALKLVQPVTTTKTSYSLTIPAGELIQVATNPEGEYYEAPLPSALSTFGAQQADIPTGIFIPSQGGTPETYWGGPGPNKINMPGSKYTLIVEQASSIAYERTTHVSVQPNSFRMELLYSGLSHNVLALTYREFKNDMLRPAFTQEVTYDLSQGREIGFRNARFRILETNNLGIKYEVLRPLAP